MIDQCANSHCNKTLHYFREGIIYAVKTSEESAAQGEHFWLCGECARTVIRDQKAGKRWSLKEVTDLKQRPVLPPFEDSNENCILSVVKPGPVVGGRFCALSAIAR
jgi:hypothetical protein